jgi:branched-chain amino acid transport system permease protein
MKGRDAKFWVGAAVVIALALAIALSRAANEYFFFAAFVVLQFVVLATAWNILGGYAGYVNFGTAAFFALGAYTAVAVIKATGGPLVVQIIAAALVSGLLGLGTGLLTLRLRGIFFSIATVAIIFIGETLIINWRYVGGATGIQLLRPPLTWPFESHTRMLFVVMAVLAVVAVSVARYIEISWIGRGLQAIRDTEEAAECSGVPTLKLKLFACTVSGALMGAAGAPLPMYLGFLEPASSFSLNYSVAALAGAIIGGTSHWLGPVIGAILLASVQQIVTVTISSEINVLVVGVLLVVFVVAAPEGILGLLRKLGTKVRRKPPAAKASAP